MAIVTGVRTGDLHFDSAQGGYPGVIDTLFMNAYALTSTDPVESDIWAGAGVNENLNWFQAPEYLEIYSSDKHDMDGESGARRLVISGLDGHWQPVSEIVRLEGETPINSRFAYLRVNSVHVENTGTWGGANVGLITLRGVDTGYAQGYIDIQAGRMAKSHFSISANQQFIARHIDLSTSIAAAVTFRLWFRDGSNLSEPYGTKQLGLVYFGVQTTINGLITNLAALPPRTDCWMTAASSKSGLPISCGLQGLLLKA
jgi:hypothetical protein